MAISSKKRKEKIEKQQKQKSLSKEFYTQKTKINGTTIIETEFGTMYMPDPNDKKPIKEARHLNCLSKKLRELNPILDSEGFELNPIYWNWEYILGKGNKTLVFVEKDDLLWVYGYNNFNDTNPSFTRIIKLDSDINTENNFDKFICSCIDFDMLEIAGANIVRLVS